MGLDRLELNSEGIQALLKSPEVQADLMRRARVIAAAAGPGHRVELDINPKRARAVVITDTLEARLSEAKYRTLTRAVGLGAHGDTGGGSSSGAAGRRAVRWSNQYGSGVYYR